MLTIAPYRKESRGKNQESRVKILWKESYNCPLLEKNQESESGVKYY
jgi:hypothetical protein